MNPDETNRTVADEKKCPQCGAPLPAGLLEGLCPACLLKQGVADSATQPAPAPFEPPPVAEVARLFPQLEIHALIGKGGMGAVYKARQAALDRWVALKILPPQSVGSTSFAERFNREARALARLSHPNIVAVHEFGQVSSAGIWPAKIRPASSLSSPPTSMSATGSAGRMPAPLPDTGSTGRMPVLLLDTGSAGKMPALLLHYFIMEFIDGVNLRQLQQAGRLSPREALQIVPQICDALQYAHDEGVVHRDIKPENVLVDRKGRVKIADFGLAKILGQETSALRLTGEGQVMGTPHYMAPEQVEHPLEVDHRADIYSLGVVFYEMLTGELPLGKFSPPSCKVKMDVRLDEVVLRALEKEPERRYQQASEVKSDVETIAGAAADVSQVKDLEKSGLSSPPARVRMPANFLLFVGLFDLVFFLMERLHYSPAAVDRPLLFPLVLADTFAQPLGVILSMLLILGAWRMRTLRTRPLALAATFLGMLITPACVIGLPLGIWTLVRLSNPEVKTAFNQLAMQARSRKFPDDPRSPGLARLGAVTVLLISTVFICSGILALFGVMPPSGVLNLTGFRQSLFFVLVPLFWAISLASPLMGWLSLDGLGAQTTHHGIMRNAVFALLALPFTTMVGKFLRPVFTWIFPDLNHPVSARPEVEIMSAGVQSNLAYWNTNDLTFGLLVLIASLIFVAVVARLADKHRDRLFANGARFYRDVWWLGAAMLMAFFWINIQSTSFALSIGSRPPPVPNTVVSGTVTDAVAGQPIARARVADNIYGGKPNRTPQETWTDTNGHYSLYTRYEEHTLAASAPGYETKLATLITKTLGIEPKVRMNFALRSIGQPLPPASLSSKALADRTSSSATGSMPAVRPSQSSQLPLLRFLAWQDENADGSPRHAWHPDGTPVKAERELRLLDRIRPVKVDVSSSNLTNRIPCFLHLWFSHPNFDSNSYSMVTLLDESGKSIELGAIGTFGTRAYPAEPGRDNLGWITYTLSPGQVGRIPPPATIRLEYTAADWQIGHDIEATFVGGMALGNGAFLNGFGQNAEGRAFVPLAVDAGMIPNQQFSFVAITKDGRQLSCRGPVTTGPSDGLLRVQRFEFDVPLEQIRAFQPRTRPIRQVEYRNIALLPTPGN